MSGLQIVTSNFQGNAISFTDDGWFNATEAAAKFGKRPVDWLNLPTTKEYISILCEVVSSEKSSLLKVKRGGKGKADATWMHPKLGVAFARWLDTKFAIWCDNQIDSILRGKIDLKKLRYEAAVSFKVMQQALQIVREEEGKATASYHYSNEARLINYVISGKYQGMDRDSLTSSEIDQLTKIEVKNAVLIMRGVEYDQRKKILEQYAIDIRSNGQELHKQIGAN